MSDSFLHTTTVMGTVVTIQVVGHGDDEAQRTRRQSAIDRAMAWFEQINDSCTRFDPTSELCRLSHTVGQPVAVSPLLYEAVRFALAVAEESGGAFDPTVGHRMAARGFDREFRTGARVERTDTAPEGTNFRHVHLDPLHPSITLLRPLQLDLGAVAKGLAVDMAVRELQPLSDFAIDAGGDLYLGGCNAEQRPWTVGIRHPRVAGELVGSIRISNGAVCTSGDYARPTPSGDGGHHLMDARTGESANALASVTVLAPSAMVADALATAAFVLGPEEGLALLERHGVEGILITPDLSMTRTPGISLD